VLWGASTALQSGSVEAFLYDRLVTDGATDDYPRLAGRMNAVMTGAFIVGGVSSGVIAAAADLQAAVLVAAVPYAVAFVFALRLSEPPHPSAKSAETSYLGTLAGAMRSLRDVPTVRWLILFQTTLSLVMVANFMFLQPFLSEYGVSVALFGILAIPIMLSRIGGGIFSHRLLDALGLRSLLVSGLLLTVAGMAIMGIIPHISAFTGLALATLAAAAINPAADGYIHDRVTSEVRATVMSVMPMGRLCFSLYPFHCSVSQQMQTSRLPSSLSAHSSLPPRAPHWRSGTSPTGATRTSAARTETRRYWSRPAVSEVSRLI